MLTKEFDTVSDKNKYHECEKLYAVNDESQKLGEFLDWLKRKYYLCEFFEDYIPELDENYSPAGYYPIRKSINQILAEYFKIDLGKIEKERRQILDELRKTYDK